MLTLVSFGMGPTDQEIALVTWGFFPFLRSSNAGRSNRRTSTGLSVVRGIGVGI